MNRKQRIETTTQDYNSRLQLKATERESMSKPLKMIQENIPGKRGYPVTSSARMHPKDHISMGMPYLAPKMTSGAR